MKNYYLLLLTLLGAFAVNAQPNNNPEIITGHLSRIADPKHPVPGWVNVKVRDENGIINKNGEQVENDEYEPPTLYPALKHTDATLKAISSGSAPATKASFDGSGYQSVCPADPTIAVGSTYVMQMINGYSGAIYQAYNKSTHTALFQNSINYLDAMTGKGGLGDPIVLYDQTDDVFILTELQNKNETGSNGLVIAIVPASTPNTSTWKSFYFNTSNFPDYPKYSISGGYLYAKTNDFKGQHYSGASIYAVSLSAMINSTSSTTSTVSMQRYSLGTANKYYSMCPVTQVGSAPTTFTEGGLFAYLNPAVWSGAGTDAIGLVELNPSTKKATDILSLSVSSYSFPASTVPQPNNGEGLDALRYRVMNEPVLRNFSTYQSLALAFPVSASGGITGIRWYELRTPQTSASSAKGFTKYQESTYSDPSATTTSDPTHRWMPSINMGGSGNIGLGYNVTNSNDIYPGIRITGALVPSSSTTPVTTYTTEAVMTSGTNTSSCRGRYGDYNHLVIDPSDDNTFWFTAMYNTNSNHSWSTSIGAFTLGTGSVYQSARTSTISSANTSISVSKSVITKTTIYPNPVHDVLNLINANTGNSIIQLLDNRSHILQQIQSASTNSRLNVSNLAAGIYMVKIISGNKVEIQKFVKN